jgi:hypothetical protein
VKSEASEDLNRTIGKDSKAAQHPKALVGGAAGAGILLGRLSSKMSLRPRLPHRNGKQQPEERLSRTQRAMNALTGSAMGTAGGQVDTFIADVFASFKSGFAGDEPRTPRVYEQARAVGARAGSYTPGAECRTTYLNREEIAPYTSSHSALDGDPEQAREILHDASVQGVSPRENMPGYPGVQGEGLAYPETSGVQAPYEEGGRSERRTGQ